MDRWACDIVKGRAARGGWVLLTVAILLAQAGCHRAERGGPPPAPPEPEERVEGNTVPAPYWLPPVEATGEAEMPSVAVVPDDSGIAGSTSGNTMSDNAAPAGKAADNASTGAVPLYDTKRNASVPSPQPEIPTGGVPRPGTASPSGAAPAPAVHEEPKHTARRPKPSAAPHPVGTSPPEESHGASLPGWAKSPEELVYRVDFIGITMGYARFRYQGKVAIAGKSAFHLNVRAWTSGVLSYIFPINETIDYYLDAETLAPIRQEFTQREREKDDVALYDQATGKITYRYRQSGKIRKQVETVPSVYDPVSVAYYFRWRDLGVENRPRNVYAGRKLYQIASRVLGNERIRTEHGEVDTIAIRPLIRRDGKPDDKGDLKIWFSSDERRVPVRLYAKFRKIKDWTLVGELIPPAGKAGG